MQNEDELLKTRHPSAKNFNKKAVKLFTLTAFYNRCQPCRLSIFAVYLIVF